jgi:hypothetical protein
MVHQKVVIVDDPEYDIQALPEIRGCCPSGFCCIEYGLA